MMVAKTESNDNTDQRTRVSASFVYLKRDNMFAVEMGRKLAKLISMHRN